MAEDTELRIIEFTIEPEKVKINRRTDYKIIAITAIISTPYAKNPPTISITNPNGDVDIQRPPTIELTRPLVKYETKFSVNRDSPSGVYDVKLEYYDLPPREGKFNVEWVEI